MGRPRTAGLKVNKQKCKFLAWAITYLGKNFRQQGVQVDHKKVEAITDVCAPEDKEGVKGSATEGNLCQM